MACLASAEIPSVSHAAQATAHVLTLATVWYYLAPALSFTSSPKSPLFLRDSDRHGLFALSQTCQARSCLRPFVMVLLP